MSTQNSLLDGRLLYNFEHMPGAYRLMNDLGKPGGSSEFVADLVMKLLLWDRLVVPTVDMICVPALVLTLGFRRTLDYFEKGIIKVVRYKGLVAYVGAGHGLTMTEIRSPSNPPPGHQAQPLPEDETQRRRQILQDSASQDPDEALRNVLGAMTIPDRLEAYDFGRLEEAVLHSIDEIPSPFFEPIFEETYHDVLGSPTMCEYFAQCNSNLKHLRNLPGDKLRVHEGRLWNDEIDVLLHLAQFNIESALASRAECDDQAGRPSARSFLEAKSERLRKSCHARETYTRLASIARLPDLTRLADDDDLCDEVLEVRDSSAADQFRTWFHERVGEDADEAARGLVDLLSATSIADKALVKACRLILTNLASLAASAVAPEAGSIIGSAVSLADSIFVERFLRRDPTPKIFVNELRAIEGRYRMLDELPRVPSTA